MEKTMKMIVTFGGAVASFIWGGGSQMLLALFVFVTFDYLSGVIASAKEGGLSSRVGGVGIARKCMIFGIVAVAHLSDGILGEVLHSATSLTYTAHLFRDGTISFYLANEGLSMIENCGRTGLPIPHIIKKAMDMFGEQTSADNPETNQTNQGE